MRQCALGANVGDNESISLKTLAIRIFRESRFIVLGVKENPDGSFFVEGLKDAHKLLKDFWNMVNNRQKVSCNILTDSMVCSESIDGKDVIVINVPRAERTSRPVYVGADPRQGTYRRNGEGDYHCSPKLEITTSSGIDRTTLSLNFEGHQPDIQGMKQLYSGMGEIVDDSESIQGSKGDIVQSKGENSNNTPESKKRLQIVIVREKVRVLPKKLP